MKKLAIFASGSGSNFEAIINACENKEIDAKVEILITDKPSAYVITRANNHNCPVFAFNPRDYKAKADYEEILNKVLEDNKIDLIVLAGYMRIISNVMLDKYEGRIINIHPSLLPAFKGAHAILDAYNYGVKVYGVTTHFIDKTMDGGKIILQDCFIANDDDTLESIETKIHAIEHILYIKTINKVLGEK